MKVQVLVWLHSGILEGVRLFLDKEKAEAFYWKWYADEDEIEEGDQDAVDNYVFYSGDELLWTEAELEVNT